MSFMQPQVYLSTYYRVETTHGTEFVPIEVVGDVSAYADPYAALQACCNGTIEGEPGDFEFITATGWLARMSAPGYMDCTEWAAFASEQQARAYLAETYPDEED